MTMLRVDQLEAINDQILVDVDPSDYKSAGGVILAESHQLRSHSGVVLSVGPRVKGEIREGDRVQFAYYRGSEVRFFADGDRTDLSEYLVLHEQDVIGVYDYGCDLDAYIQERGL